MMARKGIEGIDAGGPAGEKKRLAGDEGKWFEQNTDQEARALSFLNQLRTAAEADRRNEKRGRITFKPTLLEDRSTEYRHAGFLNSVSRLALRSPSRS
jgi:hypothetical protein